MLEFSGGCFSVRLIRELDVFSVFVSFFGGASYTRVRLICANIRYIHNNLFIHTLAVCNYRPEQLMTRSGIRFQELK